MSNLSPTIARALAPFHHAIGASDPAPAPTLPALKPGVKREAWRPPGGRLPDLIVDFIEYPAQLGRRGDYGLRMDPDYPAGVEVQAVYAGALDIFELLSDQVLAEIEEYFLSAAG